MHRRRAGQLEELVLDALWSADSPQTAGAVQSSLTAAGHELASTTVTTTLSRLADKGLLTRTPTGRAFAYAPTPQAADEAAVRMRGLLGTGTGREQVLSRFVEGLTSDDEKVLRALLDQQGGGT